MRPQDEAGYLAMVRAAQQSVDFVDQMDDYIDPRLTPSLGAAGPAARTYTVPQPSENPLNAWSHRV